MVRRATGCLSDSRPFRTLVLLLCIASVVLALAITVLPTQPAAGQAPHLADPTSAQSIADSIDSSTPTPTPTPAGDAGIWSGG